MLIGVTLDLGIDSIDFSGNSIMADSYSPYDSIAGMGVVMSDGSSRAIGFGSSSSSDHSHKSISSVYSNEYIQQQFDVLNKIDAQAEQKILKEIDLIDMRKARPTIITETKEIIKNFACKHSQLGRDTTKALGDIMISKTKVGYLFQAVGVGGLHKIVDSTFDNLNKKCK